jgi:DNA-binding transcriptional ArsR family regulator
MEIKMAVSIKENCCPPESQALMTLPVFGEQADEDLVSLGKAIGHPARIQILRLLLEKETCVCGEIVLAVSLAQSTVSQHLKVLKEAGLIHGEIEGPKTCYCINHAMLRRLKILVAAL